MQELWANILKSNKVILWCDGLKVQGQKHIAAGEPDEASSAKKKKKKNTEDDVNESVQAKIKELKSYTLVQVIHRFSTEYGQK